MNQDVLFDPHQEEGLEAIQSVRRRIVNMLSIDDVKLGSLSGDDINLLKSAMDGYDKSVFGKVKLKVTAKRDEQTNDNAKRTAMIIRSMSVMNHRPEALPSERTLPVADMQRTFVPGELEIGVEPVLVDQGMK